MNIFRFYKVIPLILAFLFMVAPVHSQNRDNLPSEYREYTNPEEIVTFDRTTSFSRALDVINEYAQKFRGKVVVNRTEMSGEIGISVPPMHWMDALKLILRVNDLLLLEQKKFFEVVTRASQQQQQVQAQGADGSGGTGEGEDEGPIATTQTYEVRINAIFFEGNRRALQEIGVDWSTISENVPESVVGGGGGQGGGQGGTGETQQIPDSRFNGPFVQVNSKGAQNVSQNVFNALINVGEIGNTGIRVQSLFSAFEADNLGEILASPTVKVMNGQQGRIQVGQDFSIKQRDIAGNVIEKFVSVGTILEVTPQVIEQNDTTFIHLDINAQRSSAQPDPVSTIINKQQAQTQALLLDDEATVIAGLYNREESEVRRGIPVLKDLPPWFFGLRYLFGYNSKDYSMRELVIVLEASLEPSIPERFNKDEFRSNYEVLRDERNRMRKEVQEGKEIMEGEQLYDGETEAQQEDTTSSDEEMPAQEKQQKETPEKEQDTTDQQKMNTQNQQKEKKEPAIADPEVKPKKVQLNLGGTQDSAMTQDKVNKEEVNTDKNVNTSANADSTETENAEQKSATFTYYLIGGSFKVEKNALDFRKKLRSQGYNAAIINMDGSDILLVAYRGYDELGSAESGLADIQQNQNSEAWLYKAN